MDWNLRRNLAKRQELFALAKGIDERRHNEIAALDDSMDDEAWDAAVDEIEKRLDSLPIYKKIISLEYPSAKNEWFRSFADSFGLCDSKRISKKQADIFCRYSEGNHERESGRGISYFVNVGKKFIECKVFPEAAYVTIKEVIDI